MSVTTQCGASLLTLGVDQLQVFFLHAPDHATSLDETLPAVQALFEKNRFTEFGGLSNFPAWQVSYIWGNLLYERPTALLPSEILRRLLLHLCPTL